MKQKEQEIEEMNIRELTIVRDLDITKLREIRNFICNMKQERRGAKKGGWEVYWKLVNEISQSYVDFLNQDGFTLNSPKNIFYDFFTGHRIHDSYYISKYMDDKIKILMGIMEKNTSTVNFSNHAEKYVNMRKIRNVLRDFMREYEERRDRYKVSNAGIMRKPGEGESVPGLLIPSVKPPAVSK